MVEVSYDMCLSEGSTGCVTASVSFFFSHCGVSVAAEQERAEKAWKARREIRQTRS